MGRGDYYREKYGRKGRGGGGGRGHNDYGSDSPRRKVSSKSGLVHTEEQLKERLVMLDRKGYPAYRDVEHETFVFSNVCSFQFCIDHVQSDPFAHPSRAHVIVENKDGQFSPEMYSSRIRRTALADYLTRSFCSTATKYRADQQAGYGAGRGGGGGGWHAAKGGDIRMDCPGQHVLERTSVQISATGDIEARFEVGLPAQGRTIQGYRAADILCTTLPLLVRDALLLSRLSEASLWAHIHCVEDQETLRQGLSRQGLVAFVCDGAVLPRASGDTDTVLQDSTVVEFESPASLRVSFTLPYRGEIFGMGVPKGVTLFVGGGFHGKSTVLQALQVGVYNHIPGDGREFVVTDSNAVKIRAEDSRSPFINNLPFGRSTVSFSTRDASGSTSQAANIVEALEIGAKVLLVDEDTCATNFMIRDRKMQQLVSSSKEPITPFIQKVRSLYEQHDVSSVLVIGGCGDYFSVADTVVMMDEYRPKDVSQQAHQIAQCDSGDQALQQRNESFDDVTARIPIAKSFVCEGKVAVKVAHSIQFGQTQLDLSAIEQIVELSQTRVIADAIQMATHRFMNDTRTLRQVLESVEQAFDETGLDALSPTDRMGTYARPRKLEIGAAINRLRCGALRLEQ